MSGQSNAKKSYLQNRFLKMKSYKKAMHQPE
ncbi:hypothetical protein BN8_05739 [Fibrisoma limi BUZ 3]|uniref:Uncharacterized protein n=1 Tax=Fibrisoma limi BUZ 3 TaxID=1185876 RepID=I2GR77_9BACT|nr:hypothetical protein BN8_05739 [Fibrisoma limi BUZ 3]